MSSYIIPKKWIAGGSNFNLHPNLQMLQTDREDPLRAPAMTLGTFNENCDFTCGELKGCTAADDLPNSRSLTMHLPNPVRYSTQISEKLRLLKVEDECVFIK